MRSFSVPDSPFLCPIRCLVGPWPGLHFFPNSDGAFGWSIYISTDIVLNMIITCILFLHKFEILLFLLIYSLFISITVVLG